MFCFFHAENKASSSELIVPPEYFYQQLIPAASNEDSYYHLDFAYLGKANEFEFILRKRKT